MYGTLNELYSDGNTMVVLYNIFRATAFSLTEMYHILF